MTRATIEIHVQALAQLLTQDKYDFPDLKSFNAYKKQQIKNYRNQLLADHLHCEISALEFSKHEQGKPFLSSHPLHFNHSHSQQNYALAISDRVRDIGVDVEDLERKIRFDALAQHAFHDQEYRIWQDTQDIEYWFKVWTTKEAVLKASGLGIRLDLNSLNTQIHPERNSGRCYHPLIGIFAYQSLIVAQKMVLTVAWRTKQSYCDFQFPQIRIL